jgi:hypothetical protein
MPEIVVDPPLPSRCHLFSGPGSRIFDDLVLIPSGLRKLRSSCLEGRRALIQPIVDFLIAAKAGFQSLPPA